MTETLILAAVEQCSGKCQSPWGGVLFLLALAMFVLVPLLVLGRKNEPSPPRK